MDMDPRFTKGWYEWTPSQNPLRGSSRFLGDSPSSTPDQMGKRFIGSAVMVDPNKKTVSFYTLTPHAHISIQAKIDGLWETNGSSWDRSFEKGLDEVFQ